MALSAMMSLGLPHLTILTKCDLVADKELLDKYINFSDEIDYFPIEKNKFLKEHEKNSQGELKDTEKAHLKQLSQLISSDAGSANSQNSKGEPSDKQSDMEIEEENKHK